MIVRFFQSDSVLFGQVQKGDNDLVRGYLGFALDDVLDLGALGIRDAGRVDHHLSLIHI